MAKTTKSESAPDNGAEKRPSNREMVWDAWKIHKKKQPSVIQDFIKDKYGVELTTSQIPNIRSDLKKNTPKKFKDKPAHKSAPAPARRNGAAKPVMSEDKVRLLFDLAHEFGRDHVRQVLDLLPD